VKLARKGIPPKISGAPVWEKKGKLIVLGGIRFAVGVGKGSVWFLKKERLWPGKMARFRQRVLGRGKETRPVG